MTIGFGATSTSKKISQSEDHVSRYDTLRGVDKRILGNRCRKIGRRANVKRDVWSSHDK